MRAGLTVGEEVYISEEVKIGYIFDKDGEKIMNDFSVSYEQQHFFSLGSADYYSHLTNDKGEKVTEENYDEWANSYIEKVYKPFLEKIGL